MAAAASLGLVTDSEIENWLMTASSATPAQVAKIIFFTSEISRPDCCQLTWGN